jgi:hypothetical protein
LGNDVGIDVSGRIAQLGIPSDAVVLEVLPPRVLQVTLQQYSRPLLAGFQIMLSSGAICTLGHSVKKFVSGVNDGNRYYLTNSHCTSQFGNVDNDAVGQPNLTNLFGVEVLDPALFANADNPWCPPGRSCRYSDAALIQVTAADAWMPGSRRQDKHR